MYALPNPDISVASAFDPNADIRIVFAMFLE